MRGGGKVTGCSKGRATSCLRTTHRQLLKGTWDLLVSKPLSWAPVPFSPHPSDAATSQHNTDSLRGHLRSSCGFCNVLSCCVGQPALPVLLCSCSQQSSGQPGLMSPSYHSLWTYNFLVWGTGGTDTGL